MLYSRHTFIFAFIISNLFVTSVFYAAQSEDRQHNALGIKTTKLKKVVNPKTSDNQVIISNRKQDVELSEKAKRNFSLFGIGITTILFLTILRLLFKEEKQSKSKTNKFTKQNYNLIDLDNKLNEINKYKISSKLAKTKVEIKKSSNNNLKYIHKAQKTGKLEIIEPEINNFQFDKLEKEKPDNTRIVNSDIMGKLTIISSSTTEIDVVYELIKDLQQNSNFQNLVRQKELRRKAIWELGQTNDFRAIKPLLQTIPKVDSLEKNLILDAITQIANHSLETINNIFITSLEDESVEVRKNAIQDLTTLYCSMSLITAHLSKMTTDSNREVRQTAKWALEQFQQMSIPVASIQHSEGRK